MAFIYFSNTKKLTTIPKKASDYWKPPPTRLKPPSLYPRLKPEAWTNNFDSPGSVPLLVVSSAEGAREIMKTHDLIFSNRPKLSIPDKLTYGSKDIGFAPYGEHWRQVKSITVLHLLSHKRVQSFRHIQERNDSKEGDSIKQVLDIDRLINNLCTIWVGRNEIHANVARFQREPLHKQSNKVNNKGTNNVNHEAKGMTNSYAHVVKGNQVQNVGMEECPNMVLDETCLNHEDFSLCLLGKVKEFASLTSLKVILVGSWFSQIIQAHNDFVIDERVIWLEVEGVPARHYSNYDRETNDIIDLHSCVEKLVPNLSESKGENECDVPAGFTTFSNVLFNADYDFDSGDDQSTFDEDFLKKIYSNPLFNEEIISMKIDQHPFNDESDLIDSMLNHDSSINISSKTYYLFDEFTSKLTLLKSISPGIDETDCHPEKETHFAKRFLYDNSSPRPSEEFVSDNSNADIESFSPSPIPNKDSDSHMEETDLPFTPEDPMPPGIEDDDYHSGRDIPILEELLDNYSLSLPANESYHFDIPSPYHPLAKPPDGKIGTLNIKMLGDVSDQKVPIPNLTITRVLNQEKSPHLLSHQGLEAFQPSAECLMIINGKNIPLLDVPLFHFYPP
nr:cytochrome P450 [Tanacetum cinerariifolium]